jgi:O-methyltransferase domain/Dimerisation domain
MTTASPGLSVEMTAHIERLGALQRLVHSGWISRAILAAVELGVPDTLAGGPRPAVDIAGDVGADATALNRLMRALTSIGLFDVSADGAYELTVVGDLLRTEARDSTRDSVLLMGGGQRAWAQLTECVRTGDHAVKLLDGIDDPFEGFSPEARAVFDEAMVAGTRLIAGAVALAYDFSGMRSIVDVGGGRGALLPPILRANPAMTGTVFDLVGCREGAVRVFEKTKIADRAEFSPATSSRTRCHPTPTRTPSRASFTTGTTNGVKRSCRRVAPPCATAPGCSSSSSSSPSARDRPTKIRGSSRTISTCSSRRAGASEQSSSTGDSWRQRVSGSRVSSQRLPRSV